MHKAIMLRKIPYNYLRKFLSSNLSAVTQTQALQKFNKTLLNNNISAHIPQTTTIGG